MNQVNESNFGILVAYLLPGLFVLWTIRGYSPLLQAWLGQAAPQTPTVGGFLYVTLAALAAGLIVSAVRWLVLDQIHHRTGIRQPDWDFSQLQRNRTAFEGIVQNHYRYYQFYGNSLISLTLAVIVDPVTHDAIRTTGIVALAAILSLALLLFIASRDALSKYYSRAAMLLLQPPVKEADRDQRLP